MGFFKKKNWLDEKPEKRIHKLEKIIDELNKGHDSFAEAEKFYRDFAAENLKEASEFGGLYAAEALASKERSDLSADHFGRKRQAVLKQLVLIENLKEREMKALQDGALTTQKSRPFCFFF